MGEAARLADQLGLYGVQLGEHIVMPLEHAPPNSVVWYDSFVLGSYLATVTREIRIILNVIVVPYRPPVQTAKMIATLDGVSNGRLTVGMGVGYMPAEFAALGAPFGKRGALTDEYVRAMKALWTEDAPSFKGEQVSFSDLAFLPKCVQQPHTPIWVGGVSRAALRRAAEFGDGWAANAGDLADLAVKIQSIKEQAWEMDRDPEALDFAYRLEIGPRDPWMESVRKGVHSQPFPTENPTTPAEIVDRIGQHRDAQFNHLLITFAWRDAHEFMDKMRWFAGEVMPGFSDASG